VLLSRSSEKVDGTTSNFKPFEVEKKREESIDSRIKQITGIMRSITHVPYYLGQPFFWEKLQTTEMSFKKKKKKKRFSKKKRRANLET
jgi:hypothetical protein